MRKCFFYVILFSNILSGINALDNDGNKPRTAFEEQQITFKHGKTSLSGVLVLPIHHTPPYPVVIFIHGSGNQRSDGYGLYPKIWAEFADKGIASLSWDKSHPHQDWNERASEVIAAINFLYTRDDIDRNSTGLWGISQAGWVMPLAIAMTDKIDFMISVSGPGGTAAEQDLYRIEKTMKAEKYDDKSIQDALAFSAKKLKLVSNEVTFERWFYFHHRVRNKPWYRFVGMFSADRDEHKQFMKNYKVNLLINARSLLEKVTCPILAIYGKDDLIVDVSKGVKAYRESAKVSGNDDLTIKIFPDASHTIQLKENKYPPEYLSIMSSWISKRFKENRPLIQIND